MKLMPLVRKMASFRATAVTEVGDEIAGEAAVALLEREAGVASDDSAESGRSHRQAGGLSLRALTRVKWPRSAQHSVDANTRMDEDLVTRCSHG